MAENINSILDAFRRDEFRSNDHRSITLPQSLTPLILIGDVIDKLKSIPNNSIDLAVTSPPYWGQRDYGIKGQIGTEKDPNEYIDKLSLVFSELRRVIKETGSFFLNIGDKYVDKNLQMIPFKLALKMQSDGWALRNIIIWHKTNPMPSSLKDRFSNNYEPIFFFVKDPDNYLTPDYFFNLDPIRIPSVTKMKTELPLTLSIEEYERLSQYPDRIRKMKEYNGKFKSTNKINLGASPGARLSVNGESYSRQRVHKISDDLEVEIIQLLRKYREMKGISSKEIDEIFGYKDTAGHWFRLDKGGRTLPKPEDWFKLKDILGIKENEYDIIMTKEHYVLQTVKANPLGKNPGDVWDFPTAKIKDSHFAVFPEELPRRIILSASPEGGIVLDPFAGSGTTLKVAKSLKRRSIGIELNRDYSRIIEKRCGRVEFA
ncbi:MULTISPECIES: DNA-methyltransferase [Cuniculiplasmataceae]|uniref:DNA-methyltransferase n=1 Tax=Cuniculiplasma sp. SKW4 TaxID=3400171 RepID=UPI003FD39384